MTSSVLDSATRNRSNSGEDTGSPEPDRKRPRLSDGKSDAENHLPEFQSSVQHNPTALESLQTPKPNLPPRPSDFTMSTPSPTSKVTINTRPLSSQSMIQPALSAVDGNADAVYSPDMEAESTLPNGSTATEAISINSSPARSPEIEIAEIEDYDQDPSETKWTRKVGGDLSAAPKIRPFHVYNHFPWANQCKPGEARYAVDSVCKILVDGSSNPIDCFNAAKEFFVDYAASCQQLTTHAIDEDPMFWAKAYSVVTNLLKRDDQAYFPIPAQDVIDFLNAYGEIAKLILEYDTRRLQTLVDAPANSPTEISLMSWYWLSPVTWIVGGKVNFFDSLETNHSIDPMTIRKPFINHVMDPSGIDLMSHIVELISAVGAALPKFPKLYKELTLLFPSLEHMVKLFTMSLSQNISTPSEVFPQAGNIRNGTERILQQLDAILQLAIKKQQAWLTIENAMEIVDSLNKCIQVLAEQVTRIAKDTITSANIDFEEEDLLHVSQTMAWAWKFTTLNRFIKHGRMELRVAGVEQISRDLVNVFYAHIQNKMHGHEHPLVKFLVRFLRGNDMTRYIVSVDSHPNLAERAANLVGFLSVAKQYTNSDTDSIWQVVEHGQDPRMVGAALHLLNGCFVTYTLPDFHYVCQKILDLPYEKVDDRVLQFTFSVLSNIRQKANHQTFMFDTKYDPITRRLCMKLLREANTSARCATDHGHVVRREIIPMLTQFIQPTRPFSEILAINEEELAELTGQIRQDIDSHGEHACGAVLALHEILSLTSLGSNTAVQLADQSACPAILVENIASFSALARANPASPFDSLFIQFESRLQCLTTLLRLVADRFDKELVESIWNSVLTARHLPEAVRVLAWNNLTTLMRQYKSSNTALKIILDDFWTELRPSDFNKATLDFAKQSVLYESAQSGQIGAITAEGVISIPGIERVWKIMLECLPGTIEMEATDFIILQYLKSPVIMRRPKPEIHETHLSLIDRCVSQVIGSAGRLKSFAENGAQSDGDDGMIIVASQDEITSEELKFDRSLLFLRCFTNALKKDPTASPVSTRHSEELPDFENIKGEVKLISLKIQANRYVADATRKIAVGTDNTGLELGKYISNVTGWSQFTTIHAGRKINLQEDTSTLTELRCFLGMPLILCKTTSTEEKLPQGYRAGSPVDEKIMLHFDDLYALLDLDNRLAKEVYDFLRLTSVRDKISEPIKAMSTPPSDLLPPQKPYKLLFCTEALKACIEVEYFSKTPDIGFLVYAVDALNQALAKIGLIGFTDPLYMSITYELLETLSMACRTKVPTENSLTYFRKPQDLVKQITQFLTCAQQSRAVGMTQKEPETLVKIALEVLFEACLHDGRTWPAINEHTPFHRVFRQCVLDDDREAVRRAILDVVLSLNGSAGSKITFKLSNPHAARARFDASIVEACLAHIWKLLFPVLASAAEMPTRCHEVCDAGLIILKGIGKAMSTEDLQTMFDQWSITLLQHVHYEIVGQALHDRYIAGVTKLLCEAARLLRGRAALLSQARLTQALILTFLFPPLSDSRQNLANPRRPVLDAMTRQTLYDLLLILCQTSDENDALRSETSNDFVERNYFQPHITNDRQAIRSEVGYAGLRNLSNTCYLNSLLSQLFMHVKFRHLLLNTEIIDNEKQKLFLELGKVFAHMQSSHEKAIDPQGAVESIVTYEGGEIDVTIQMDVDEFFNLLFDRLEGQIVDEKLKFYFKSLYGGETIQQIKSKECEHVSERPESFAVLPVEIKGKTRLEDSLKAYVEGEVLQGDNKYSCTSCGRHVDAVKRNCLKKVPDNLIFNLKRFDFDIMTGTRCKLNDLFQFPDELDVAPYTLEHLSQPDEAITSDIFELTGVIVHSGTAETGHYFSYIRQRPSARDKAHSWVQFNDSDVTQFDPAHMQDNCFGGVDNNCYGLIKFYNAYMLFYQRKSDIQETEARFLHADPVNPVRLNADEDLENHISQQNELFLRAYCVQDENHARFVRELLAKLWDNRGEECSEDHFIEDRALKSTLEYVQQISSRWKGQPEMEDTLKIVLSFTGKCVSCARAVCEWMTQADIICDSIVRSPYGATRKAFCSVLRGSLETLHREVEANPQETKAYKEVLEACFSALAGAWDHTFRHARCWVEYFGLLNDILLFGELEVDAMMDFEFLDFCLEIIRLHTLEAGEIRTERRNRTRYNVYLNAREKGRTFNHVAMINFFAELFLQYELRRGSRASTRGLTVTERELLGMNQIPYSLKWLNKIISGKQSPAAATRIVARLAQDSDLAGPLSQALNLGAEHKNMGVAVAYLDPIVTFCQHGVHENQIIDLVAAVLEGFQTIDLGYGSEYLLFVEQLLASKNEVGNWEPGFLADKLLEAMPGWASVLLVAPNESQHDVRGGTVALIQSLLLEPLEKAREEDPPKHRQLQQTASQLAHRGVLYARNSFTGRTKESSVMQPGQFNQLAGVVEKVLELLEPDGVISEQRQLEMTNTLTTLRLKNEHAVETLSPENWQESSDLDGGSEQDFEDMISP